MDIELYGQILEKYSNTRFHQRPVQWEQSCSMRTDGRTDLAKLIVALRNFANAPQNVNRIRQHDAAN